MVRYVHEAAFPRPFCHVLFKPVYSSDSLLNQMILRLACAWGSVAAFQLFGDALLGLLGAPLPSALVFAWLLCVIVWAAFGVVHEAEELAHRLGEPYGTLILTLSIVIIEVALIAP